MEPHNSPAVLAFEKQIAAAELGDEKSIKFCRMFLADCAKDVSLTNLIKLCRCLLEIGRDPYTT